MTAFELEKAQWSDADFETMGWHDCWIYSVAFDSESWSFLLDLDYIFQWVEPAEGETNYKFWIAPASMVFENVHSVRIDLDTSGGIEVDDLRRGDARPTANGGMLERQYVFECQEGVLSLWTTGFRQIIRAVPVLSSAQSLTLVQRGGVCFDQNPCAT